MKRVLQLFAFAGLFLIPSISSAIATEIGINYSRKKTSFDADNFLDSESTTGSISFYFMEKLALEMSYTSAVGVREEKVLAGTTVISQQTVVQTTQVYGADLIWVLSDRRSFFQPYIKGGAAQIRRVQDVKVNSLVYSLEPEVAVAPSYGVGFKLALTDQFGIKISYDGWQTPIGEGQVSNDASVRAGITWML